MFRVLFVLTTVVAIALAQPSGRIVGGEDASINQFPWQTSLRVLRSDGSYAHNCGASILSPLVVVCAAHCLSGYNAQNLGLVAGVTALDEKAKVLQIEKTFVNPDYDSWSISNDVGLIILKEALVFNNKIQPLKALAQQSPADGTNVIVTGWGTTSEGGYSSNVLQQVTVKIVGNDKCAKSYGSSTPITESMICAGVENGGKDACQGDSGGPLVEDGVLVGIVSWGRGCARSGYPGVYSNVASLRGWILDTAAPYL